MKVIVAGGRDFNWYNLMKVRLDNYFKDITPTIVCGEARGADSLGRRYAEEKGLAIESYPADWNKYGKSAGYKRNELMAQNADALVAFWDGKSKGTKHMINTMLKLDKPVKVVYY